MEWERVRNCISKLFVQSLINWFYYILFYLYAKIILISTILYFFPTPSFPDVGSSTWRHSRPSVDESEINPTVQNPHLKETKIKPGTPNPPPTQPFPLNISKTCDWNVHHKCRSTSLQWAPHSGPWWWCYQSSNFFSLK